MRSATIKSHTVEIVADIMQSGDIAFMIICTALVFLMIPGVGYVYASRSIKHSILMITTDSSILV
jgi:ammonia channel protein AmtB